MHTTRFFSGSFGVFIAAALLTLMACGGGNDTPVMADAMDQADAFGRCSAEPPTGAPADGVMNGTYAAFTRYQAVVQGLSSVQIARTWFVQEYTQSGEELTLTETLCNVEIDSTGGSIEIRVSPGYVESLPEETRTGSVSATVDGYQLTLDRHYIARGVTLADIENDPLPTMASDPAIGDWDDDGKPGMTLFLGGILSGQLFNIQRDFSEFTGTQVFADRFSGTVAWNSEQVYLGAEPEAILDLVMMSMPEPDPDVHTFQIVKVPDGSDCAYVLANRCDLFEDSDEAL